jgi:hypothetical protein
MGKNISRPKQVTDWFARLEKLEQALAADSGSGLLVQPAWIEKNVPDICATNSLVRKGPACLCQVHRLLAADRGWGGAIAHREAEGRRFEHQAGRDESSWYAPYRGQASLAVGARVGRSSFSLIVPLGRAPSPRNAYAYVAMLHVRLRL